MAKLTINKDERYTIGDRWIFRNDENYNNQYTLYNIDTNEIIYLNRGLYMFFKLLAKMCLSYNDLNEFFIEKGISFDWQYLDNLLLKCKTNDLLSVSYIPYADKYILREPDTVSTIGNNVPIATSPIEAEMHLTHKCNLNCLHCFQKSNRYSNKFGQLSVEAWLKIFKQFEDNNIHNVVISGGEPLFYAGFNQLIPQIVDMRFSLVILTNGTLVNDKNIDYLSRTNVHNSISLDGADIETHDFLRGKGSFNLVSKSILALSKRNAKISISTTIHKYNYLHLDDIAKYLIDNKISRMSLNIVDPIGRAKLNNEIILANDEIKRANESVQSIKERYKGIIDIEIFDLTSKNAIINNSTDKIYCTAGTRRIAVSADGILYPCVYAFGYKSLEKGDLTKDNLIDLWHDNNLWTEQRGAITIDDIPSCGSCEFKDRCSMKNCRIKDYNEKDGLLNKPGYCLKDRYALTV